MIWVMSCVYCSPVRNWSDGMPRLGIFKNAQVKSNSSSNWFSSNRNLSGALASGSAIMFHPRPWPCQLPGKLLSLPSAGSPCIAWTNRLPRNADIASNVNIIAP